MTTQQIRYEQSPLLNIRMVYPALFEDFRGANIETYNASVYPLDVVQTNITMSRRNVLRGIHVLPHERVMSCIHGYVFFVVVDPERELHEEFLLSDRHYLQLVIPPNYGTGFVVLSDKALIQYIQTGFYNINEQKTIKYNDPRYNIRWPVKDPVTSRRDDAAISTILSN